MKPIEPGCLVVILVAEAPEIIGCCGTVIGPNRGPFISQNTGALYEGKGWWDVDLGDCTACRPPHSLLRIDGGEDESVTDRHDEEVSA